MPRFRRSFRRRGTRGRTRWLSIIPNARTHGDNNAYSFNLLQLQQSGPSGAVTVPLNEFVGGTILRVLLDVQVETPVTPQDGNLTFWGYLHAGLFVTAEVSPNVTIWDPNVPSGNFMQRESVYHYGQQFSLQGNTIGWGYKLTNGGTTVMRFDTNVKRRIRENEGLFVSWRSFLDDVGIENILTGWTGRVLVRLP